MATHQITQAHAKQAVARLESIKRKIASVRESAAEKTEQLVGTVETAGAAFAMGVLQGKAGSVELFGVPLELALGLGLSGFALLGGAGKASTHIQHVGNGCLAAYATTLGRGVGTHWAAKSQHQVTATKTSGLAPGGGVSAMDLAMAQAAAAGMNG